MAAGASHSCPALNGRQAGPHCYQVKSSLMEAAVQLALLAAHPAQLHWAQLQSLARQPDACAERHWAAACAQLLPPSILPL